MPDWLAEARGFLARREKHPRRLPDGRWRWAMSGSLADGADGMCVLPKDAFARLPAEPGQQYPWIFSTHARAAQAAELAVMWAMRSGCYELCIREAEAEPAGHAG